MDSYADLVAPPQAPLVKPVDSYADLVYDPVAHAQAVSASNAYTDSGVAGKSAVIGRQIGLPQSAVETDLPNYTTQAKIQKNSAILSDNPVLARWVAAQPDAARIAQNEYDKLSTIEKAWNGTKQLGYGAVQGLGGTFNSAALAMNRALYPLAAIAGQEDWWYRNQIAPLKEAAPTFNEGEGFMRGLGQITGGLAGVFGLIAATGGMGEAATVDQTAGALTALAHGVRHAATTMWAPATSAAINTGSETYNATGNAGTAMLASATAGASQVAMGVIPLSAPGGLLKRAVTGGLAMGVQTEAERSVMNMILPDNMQRPFNPQELATSVAQGAIMGGLMGPRDNHFDTYMEAVRQTYTDSAKAAIAERDIGKVATLGNIAKESELNKSDPEAFKSFLQSVTEDSNLDAVYINGAKLADAFANAKMDVPDSIAKQLEESKLTNGDVRIPIAEYGSVAPIQDAILQDLKPSADGMTYADGQKFYTDAVKNMTDRAKALEQARIERQAVEEDTGKVRQALYDNMVKAGRDPSIAKTEAELATTVYAAQAKREGVKASDLFNENPVRFGEPSKDGTLEQPARNQELIDLRKRESVLKSILECIA